MTHVGDVRFDGLTRVNARILLAAAEKAGLPPESVRTDSDGFIVPAEVAEQVGPDEGQVIETTKPAKPKSRRGRKKGPARAGPAD